MFAPNAPGEVIGAYDAIDLPPIAPLVERHRRFAGACPNCGRTDEGGGAGGGVRLAPGSASGAGSSGRTS